MLPTTRTAAVVLRGGGVVVERQTLWVTCVGIEPTTRATSADSQVGARRLDSTYVSDVASDSQRLADHRTTMYDFMISLIPVHMYTLNGGLTS